MSDPDSESDAAGAARRGIRRAPSPRRTPVAGRVRGEVPGTGRADPRPLPGHGADRAIRLRRGPRHRPGWRARVGRMPGAPAAGGLSHPPRGGPGRHGGRLRGGAGIARPARGPEGAPLARPGLPDPHGAFPAGGARRPGCTTRTSCRSSASASRTGSTTMRCSTSGARAWTWSSPSCGASAKVGRRARICRRVRPGRHPGPHADPGPVHRPFRRTGRGRRRRPGRGGRVVRRCRADRRTGRSRRPPRRRASVEPGRPCRSVLPRLGGELLPRRRPRRAPGGRGAGLRALAGHPPPRHQALQPAPGRQRHRLGRRLRAGQGRGDRRPDAVRRHRRDAALHGPRAVRGPLRPPRRRLRPGCDAL